MKPVVLITGSTGLIGRYLARTAARWAPEYRICGLTRADADLLDHRAVTDLFGRLNPDAVIHCAALSRAGLCQDNPDLARRTNVEGTQRLAELSSDIPFVFFSSDQVFDGTQGGYIESDQVNPLNVYGQTKAEAEQVVLQNPAHSVIRVALTAGSSPTRDRSFVEDMLRASVNGMRLTLFTDEFRCPLPAGVIARAIWELIEHDRPGLYHLGGKERLSRWEIGELLARWYPQLRPCIQ
ncbi:MAG: SDR family oxidoreductase, partial [Nitrospiraceae bacterium]